ncbi:Leucine-rich repeat-containing protein [Artemisia annua]|uniref:Leucine-rich repeat-containing protein n=1 Tax=Artemisia annua TaxID=35608 RepID=A0A2U1K912_ARTAN|nr:Leucine-rich repeat-containing protein [Artemisia annua]
MLQGTIHPHSSLFNLLTHLTWLDLSSNSLNGTLPSWLFTSPSLEALFLDGNMFSGNVPFDSFALPSLIGLDLSNNQLGGQIDVQTFPQLTNLTGMYLSQNNFSGELELDTLLSTLTNLEVLRLSYNGFSVTTKNTNHYVNPGFRELYLASCRLKVFPNSLRAMKKLEILDLSQNEIHGQIPHWAGEIGGTYGLSYVNLSHNFITGLPQFQWYGLRYLYLQSNLIEGPFPPSICNMSDLGYLDMSNNRFGGVIPECVGSMSTLSMIDLGTNNFHGTIPKNISSSLEDLNVKSNKIEGSFPPSICNLSNLRSLDMSNNSFGGVIPECVGSMMSTLSMINLGTNNFRGTIPNVFNEFVYFEGLILNGNLLEGEVPHSLSKCQSLKVLDLGNNKLSGAFPKWLGGLSELQVLVLKSNNFHGPIEIYTSMEHAFSSLQVLDLSHNWFAGKLPDIFYQNFKVRQNMCEPLSSPDVYGDGDESGFTWKVVTLGYGCGTLLGLVMGYLMLSTRKVKWFNAIADAAESLAEEFWGGAGIL